MGTYQVLRKANNQLLIGFVCSRCNNARTLVIDAYIEQQNISVGYPSSTSGEQIMQDAYSTLSKEIGRRARAGESLINSFSIGVISGRAVVELSGVQTPCPFCGNKEPWQTIFRIEEEYAKLKPENYPTAWSNVDIANAWLNQTINQRTRELQEFWTNNQERLQQVNKEKDQIKKRLASINEEITTYTETLKRDLERKTAQRETLEKSRIKAGFFSSERRELTQQIKEYDKKIRELNQTIKVKEKELDLEAQALNEEYQELAKSSEGASGLVTKIDKNNATTWFIE